MKRQIIEIDEELCTGCGDCVSACAEGAIQLVDGKAKVVKEQYCDGLGACVGDCPTGALKVVEREAPEFDAAATEQHVRTLRGDDGVRRMQEFQHAAPPVAAPPRAPAPSGHGHSHGGGGCPGSRVVSGPPAAQAAQAAQPMAGTGLPPKVNQPDLAQWPIQLHLVPTRAPFFTDRELLVLATCGPVASADVHWRFLRGRSVVVACPKLDITDPYVEKLAAIFRDNGIPRVIVLRMEVPCCGGLTRMVQQAYQQSGRRDMTVTEFVVGLDGSVQSERSLV